MPRLNLRSVYIINGKISTLSWEKKNQNNMNTLATQITQKTADFLPLAGPREQ